LTPLSIKELLAAGVHYGHRTSRWHPDMAPYIYGKRKGIHIIDLRQTVRGIAQARRFLHALASQGKRVLVVGTKRQAAAVVREEAGARGIPYVADRWLGGTLTNFQTIRKSLGRLEQLERLEQTEEFASYTKKMISMHNREKRKILRNLSGIRDMDSLPAALLVVDPRRDKIAVREARKLDIPVVALMDTDSDPGEVTICIPCNDDSIRSIQVVLKAVIEAVEEGMALAGAAAADQPPAQAEEKPAASQPTQPKPPPSDEKPAPEQQPAPPAADGAASPADGEAPATT